GGDDIFWQLGLLQAGAITPAQLQANVALAATQLAQQVGVLQAAGTRYLIVWNVPDIGISPFGRATGMGPALTAISQLFNTTFLAGLDALGGQTIRLNGFGLVNEVAANPAAYGFANVTSPACGATRALLCTPA